MPAEAAPPPAPGPRAVLWDMDGTLVDSDQPVGEMPATCCRALEAFRDGLDDLWPGKKVALSGVVGARTVAGPAGAAVGRTDPVPPAR